MIVLDASVVISFLESTDVMHASAQSLIAREIEADFAINVLTLAEVLVAPIRRNQARAVEDLLRDLEVLELGFPTGAAARLAQLRATTSLRMPDCCVLLSALDHQARVASFDQRLGRAANDLGLTMIRS